MKSAYIARIFTESKTTIDATVPMITGTLQACSKSFGVMTDISGIDVVVETVVSAKIYFCYLNNLHYLIGEIEKGINQDTNYDCVTSINTTNIFMQ